MSEEEPPQEWPINRPDTLEDICTRFIAQNLHVIAEQGVARLPPLDSATEPMDSEDDLNDEYEGAAAAKPPPIPGIVKNKNEEGSSVDPEVKTCYHIRDGIYLSKSVCDRLLAVILDEEGREVTYEKLSIFANTEATRLDRADLRKVAGESLMMGLRMLSGQPLSELTMPCLWRGLPLIRRFKTLRSLRLEKEPLGNAIDALYQMRKRKANSKSIQSMVSELDAAPSLTDEESEQYYLPRDNLRHLVMHNLQFRYLSMRDNGFNNKIASLLLTPLTRLTSLSLSMCRLEVDQLPCLSTLTNLLSLNLSNVKISSFEAAIDILRPLKLLRHLDISHSEEDYIPMQYHDPDTQLKNLMDALPALISLDISGTNLAGFEPPEVVSHRLVPKKSGQVMEVEERKTNTQCIIRGLEGRQLEFLGLYTCAFGACTRKNIPAKRVTGDADSKQVVLAVQVYLDNYLLLVKALNELFNLFRFSTVHNHRQALEAVFAAMKAYPKDSSIQIAGSASLFYLAKGHQKNYISYQHKREMGHLLLTAMNEHCFDQTMMRNACLTLCHLNLPNDLMFCYERLVRQLLEMLKYDYRDPFIHRLGIFLLNCMACQVDGKEKQLVGSLGAVETMLQIIWGKLRGTECDDVLEVAWSTLWNVTDETPNNCEKFLESGGMTLFVSCLKKFEDKPELLRNMMGLMGNIAEVDALRHHLMQEEYVSIFSNLLGSESDGIEVSYNACGVLSHLCFDGKEAWTLENPSRDEVMDRMEQAIDRWCLQSKRNINYRSFAPILRLVQHYDTPIVQHWSCWALCNLTCVSPDKYCHLLEREGGREALEGILKDGQPASPVRNLVKQTLRQLNRVREKGGCGGDGNSQDFEDVDVERVEDDAGAEDMDDEEEGNDEEGGDEEEREAEEDLDEGADDDDRGGDEGENKEEDGDIDGIDNEGMAVEDPA